MAKRGNRTDWQLDLKPALGVPRTADLAPNGNGHGNGAGWLGDANANANAQVNKILAELRANDEAMLGALADIRATLETLRFGIEELTARVVSVEAKVASQAAERPARPTRPVRDTSRALRESSTGTFDRRARRGSLRIAEDDSSS
jgi:hypothetical protein